ncbi:MAG: hypothetical protein ACYC6Y_05495 [Thermoguttaceae bacterium]
MSQVAVAPSPSRQRAPRRALAGAAILSALFLTPARSGGAEDYLAATLKLTDQYRAELGELAAWCDEKKLGDQGQATRNWVKPRDPTRLYVSVLPDAVGPPEPVEGASADVTAWHKRFHELRAGQAGSYYTLARKAVKAGQASLAFDLIMAALREDPDHKSIREMLGFRQYRGQWLTNYEVKRAQDGYVWHDRFGWIKRNQVGQYEEGKRLYQGRWITAEEDARIHAEIHSGWLVPTEHYNILTNRSIEEAVALGTRLEGLYRVWKQLFIRYYASEAQVAGLFEGRAARLQLPQHNVVYFGDRQGYVAALKPNVPSIDISLGIYVHGATAISQKPAMYFFAGQDSDEPTLFHEATHQLFHETPTWQISPAVGQGGNFWVIEGVAMYFESLKEQDGFHVLGGFDAERNRVAGIRLFQPEYRFYEPLTQFCQLGIAQLQGDQERIFARYTQAAGLFFFLMHYDNGRYRDAVVSYLSAVYSGRDNPQTLSRLTGKSYEELDKEYQDFMAEGNQAQ